MSGTAVGRTVFVLGKQINGNREVLVYEDGQEYGLYDTTTLTTYTTVPNTRFPYDM